ncbi:MAG: DUF814 domain-containing protein [Candidatus Latescibacteria bacterium]|nr:DUF814 domain-containing protein [bacterium]MCB9515631.1 DUF814 domain-containing protein [Candidatus Latescibacterota bacterium]
MDFPNLLMAAPLLDALQGQRLQRVTWNGPVAALVFDSGRGSEVLVLHLHQEVQSLHLDTTLHEEFEHIQFQDRRHDFSFLPPHLEGATYLGAAPIRGQSLLRLDFGTQGNFKEDSRLHLYVEFFAGGRAVLTDGTGRVIRASRKGAIEHKPGAQYLAGAGPVVDPGQDLPMGPEGFDGWRPELLERVRQGGDGRIPSEHCQGVRGFKPDSVRYLAQRPRAHAKDDPRVILANRLQRWVNRVLNGREGVNVLSFPPELHRGCQIMPFPLTDEDSLALEHDAISVSRFDHYPTALNYMGRGCLARYQMRELIEGLRRGLEQRLAHNRRLLTKLEKDWERAASAGDLRRQADSLAAHLGQVKRGMEHIELDDVHDGERRVDIPLDPARSPQDNLGRLYQRAAKGERGLQTVELRLEEVRRRVVEDEETLGERLPTLAKCRCRDLAEINALREELLRLGHSASLFDLRRSAPGARPQPAQRPFRRYSLPGGWEVLVGRNNAENDQLTHREADGRDLWFHAAGASGSHVILRTGGHRSGPPRSIVEAAAAIAAFHSKARHSGLVPVIYTEKRYVRKPRKGTPGLALCTREKTVFVKPEVPGVQAPGA